MVAENIIRTLQVYDPEQTTVTVGSAAIAIHFSRAGLDFAAEDVDTLCSEDFFKTRCMAAISAAPDTIHKFQIRYPYGEPRTRALSPTLDIYPGEKLSPEVLSFSASTALGGQWHPMSYDDCVKQPGKTVRHEGFMFLSMAEVLLWTAKAGREKDIVKVSKLLPVSVEKKLISSVQYKLISTELEKSKTLRALYPHRHFARVEP